MDLNKIKALVAELQAELSGVTTTSTGAIMLIDNGDDTLTLTRTGHIVPVPRPELGEMQTGYFMRIASKIGSDANIAASLWAMGTAFNVSFTGDPKVDWPLNLDSFANPVAYGTGKAGENNTGAYGPKPVPAPPSGEEPL